MHHRPYDPRAANKVADGVHAAVSEGVRAWLQQMLTDVSQLCDFRMHTEQEFADEEISFPRKQIEAFNQVSSSTCAKHVLWIDRAVCGQKASCKLHVPRLLFCRAWQLWTLWKRRQDATFCALFSVCRLLSACHPHSVYVCMALRTQHVVGQKDGRAGGSSTHRTAGKGWHPRRQDRFE